MKRFFSLTAIAVVFSVFISSCNKDNGCAAGYSGSSCATINTPTQMTITSITVTGFSELQTNGNDWNSGGTGQANASGFANIYPVITDASGNVIYNFSQNAVINAAYQSSYTFTPSAPITITNPTASYNLALFNSQAGCGSCIGSDPLMGYVACVPFTAGQAVGFPGSITAVGGGVGFRVAVTYTH